MATLFPQLDPDKLRRLHTRRPTPTLREVQMQVDRDLITDLMARADELLVQQHEAKDAAAQSRARERLSRKDKVLPSPGDWISSQHHVGGIELWPAVKDAFVEIIESGANIIVLRGGSGTAKSFLAESLIHRSIAEFGCMAHLHGKLGQLSKTTPITIPLMHVKREMARDEMLNRLRARIVDAPWFREHFPLPARTYNLGVGSTHLKFPTVTVKPVPTTQQALVGQVIPAFWATECNEYDIVEKSSRGRGESIYDVGMEVFRECLTRLKRFHRPLHNSIRYVFDSTERYEGDLTSRLTDILPMTGLKHIVVMRSQWEMKPGALKGPFFFFAKPTKGKRGEVVEDPQRRSALERDGREVVEVPVGDEDEYLIPARETPDLFSRDLGGWPVDAISRFVDNPEQLARCVREREAFLADMGIEDDPAEAIEDEHLPGHGQIDWDRMCTYDPSRGTWRPRVLPDVPRVVHFDLASGGKSGGDFIGMSMGARADEVDRLPTVWYDFAIRLTRDGVRYDFEKARQFLEDLRRHGFRIRLVTFDSFQSVDFQNILRGWGYQVDQISMVRTMDGYIAFQAGYLAGQALLPAWDGSVILEELVQLERKVVNNKEVVEHRPKRHDDVAQAVAAVYWQIKTRGPMDGTGIMAGKPEHPRTMERRIADMTAELWDQTNEVPAQYVAKERRRIAIETRRREHAHNRDLRDELARIRAAKAKAAGRRL